MSEVRYPIPTLGINGQDEVITLAMCLYGEARGESIDTAMQGVASVILNRAAHPKWWGKDIKSVILQPWQFSSFNLNDPNRVKLLYPTKTESEATWARCFKMAESVISNVLGDNTFGATHYYDTSISPPSWAKMANLTVQYGRIKFFNRVK
jgi:N-acetylmuramoyl-L-alanine amidase